MNSLFAGLLAIATLYLVSSSFAEPLKTQAQAEAAAKSATIPSAPGNDGSIPLKTGVYINAITRNDTISAEAITLASRAKSLQPIVLSASAGPMTKLAAVELKKYLEQMTGAVFEMKVGDGASGIVVGTLAEFPNPELAPALEVKNFLDGKDAYAIRTTASRLLILGATDLAASHATYRFLDEVGCRWFFPDADGTWQVVPTLAELKFKKNITDRPAFLERRIWYAWDNFSDGMHPFTTAERPRSSGGDSNDWGRRNRMIGNFVTNAGHAYEAIAQEHAAEFAAHPEYWALVDGKRTGPQFELGNPALRKLVVDWAINHFKKNPTADMVSVDPADGFGTSQSDEAKAYGNPSDSAFKLANEVAVALQNAYPGQNKMVGMYAYNWHSDPPPFSLEPNVYIQLTIGFNGGELTLDELFEKWPAKAMNLGFYDYYSTWRWDGDMWPGGRVANKNYPVSMIRRFQKANAASRAYATSISAESSNNWGVNGRGYYLASKLMWNPDQDAEVILNDFYEKAFGPAAAAMKKYYNYQDDPRPISPGVVGALFRTMNEARRAARSRPDVMRRLDHLAAYLHYFDMGYRGGEINLTEKWRTAYRGRYTYMNHWAAIANDVMHGNNDPKVPWRDNAPITHEETETWVQNAIQHYPDLVIPPVVQFSEDLVPVEFEGESVDTSQLYQEGSMYSVLSKGEPIHIRIEAGGAYGGLKQTYALTNAKGKVISEGKPKAREKLEFDIPVPEPGIYHFEFHDHGAYGQVFWNKNQIVALPLKDRHFRAMARINDLYFYVPKGTREINYYYKRADWQFGGPHQLSTPNGKVVKEIAVDGDYVSVPVPEGMDGKVWKIGGPSFGLGFFNFFNIPGYFSPSPAKLLLPREIAMKDRLNIVK